MPAVNFRDLLSLPTDQAERPKAFPECWLKATCVSHELTAVPWDRETLGVRFSYRPEGLAESPSGEDLGVTESDLPYEFHRRQLSHIFPITVEERYRLADYLDAVLGKESGRTFNERIPDTRGANVIIHVTQRKSKTSDDVYNDVREVFAA